MLMIVDTNPFIHGNIGGSALKYSIVMAFAQPLDVP